MRAVAHISPCNEGKPSSAPERRVGSRPPLLSWKSLLSTSAVGASVRTKQVLQAREIRRIGFSVAISYPLRVSTELKKALLSAAESKAERTALLCKVQFEKLSASKIQLISRADKSLITLVLNHINSTTKQNEGSSSFRACFCCLS